MRVSLVRGGIAGLVAAGALARVLSGQEVNVPLPTPTPTSPAAAAMTSATPTALPATSPEPTATVAPTSAPPTPTPAPALRIVDPPTLSISTLPPENPFGANVEAPAASPQRPQAPDSVESVALFAAVRVDAKGRALSSRRLRDPIPSLSAETERSLLRWVFEPGRRAGQPAETWAAVRIELVVEVDSPKLEQVTLDPVIPSTPIATPFPWPTDAAWLEAAKAAPPSDGTVPTEQLEPPPVPRKTPWSADSYKGPFAVRFWVRIGASGRAEKAFPLQASDPVLIGYFRKAIASWPFRPAQAGGNPVSTWNELTLKGQISYSVDIKQIASLRQSL